MNNDTQKNMILNDNMWSVMWKLSWPAIVAMVLYGMNTMLDAIFVGYFVGETALAGVSIVFPLTQLTLSFGQLIGVGAGSLLSILIGANDKARQERLIGNVNYLTILCSVVMTILGVIFAPQLVSMMGGRGGSGLEGTNYFRITLYFSVFWIYGLAGNMIVRAEGKMKSAAVMMGIGMVVNIIFNYIFIALFGWGVKGAAWGTNIGMLVYTILFILYIRLDKVSFKSKIFSIHRDADIIKQIISLGLPSFIMGIMFLIQGIVVFNAFAVVGTDSDIALYGLLFRISQFLMTPIFGLMRALQPAVGINFGAKNYKRIISFFKIFAVVALLLILPFWLLIEIAPHMILPAILQGRIFSATDIFNTRIFMLLIPVLPFLFMAMTMFPAINKPKPVTIMGMARQLVFYVPVMLILPRLFGVSWIYLGSFLIDAVMLLWTVFIVLREFGRLRRGEVNQIEKSPN